MERRQASVTTMLPKLDGKDLIHNEYANDSYNKEKTNTINVVDHREKTNASPIRERCI